MPIGGTRFIWRATLGSLEHQARDAAGIDYRRGAALDYELMSLFSTESQPHSSWQHGGALCAKILVGRSSSTPYMPATDPAELGVGLCCPDALLCYDAASLCVMLLLIDLDPRLEQLRLSSVVLSAIIALAALLASCTVTMLDVVAT